MSGGIHRSDLGIESREKFPLEFEECPPNCVLLSITELGNLN